jgi:D-alanyl-D-alanine dipeptidase
LYHGESLIFERNGDDVTAVLAAGIRFPRRTSAGEETFTIDPVRPVAELRAEAFAASPPEETGEFVEPDLVELRSLDSTILYDIRYATTNNFMQAVFYDAPRAFMQRPAAEALVSAHRQLRQRGYGLLIHDAYRPWYVTRMFWDATPDSLTIFVANPANGSRHNRGAAVDLTLYDLDSGDPVRMVGGYDEFSDRSFPGYPGGTARQRWHRELLRRTMEDQGFDVYEFEWWHFDFGDWSRYPISNLRFEELIPEPAQR